MGNRNTKSSLRNAIVFLNISADPISAEDEKFWLQIWSEDAASAADIISAIRTQEIRMLRDGSARNFATLAYKSVERICLATNTLCNTTSQQTAVLNASRILTRLIPCIYEDKSWRNFFSNNHLRAENDGNSARRQLKLVYPEKGNDERNYLSYLPGVSAALVPQEDLQAENDCILVNNDKDIVDQTIDLLDPVDIKPRKEETKTDKANEGCETLMKSLITALCDLLFCPEFTVTSHSDGYLSNSVDTPPEDLRSLASCDYIWEPGVGFESSVNSTTYYDSARSELLRLLLACLSQTLYESSESCIGSRNEAMEVFVSSGNKHTLAILASLLNTIFIYKPTKLLPFNHLLFQDTRKDLVELCIHILIVALDFQSATGSSDEATDPSEANTNMFEEFLSRIHRSEDLQFIVDGFARLLNHRMEQSYLSSSSRGINFDQELLILFWKICNLNKKFISHLLKTKDAMDVVVPILFHLNENFQDPTKTALIHVGVFILLRLSGERNFGCRLNKPYKSSVLTDLPQFAGSHADLMIIVFHKLILYGLNLNQLYDYLLTILVNISPYLKSVAGLSSMCLIQLFEIFSSPYVVLTEPNYHQLVVFLLEIFNNIVQYQFDGNANLVYAIARKKDIFLELKSLPSSQTAIEKVLNKLIAYKRQNMLVEKVLAEQASVSADSAAGQPAHGDGMMSEPTSRTSATWSMDHSNTSSSSNANPSVRSEVCLVETPEISQVIQQVHPFDTDNPDAHWMGSPVVRQPASESSKVPTTNANNSNEANTNSLLLNVDDDEDGGGGGGGDDDDLDVLGQSRQETATLGNQNEARAADQATYEKRTSPRWQPTPDWVKQWKRSLPLPTILRMIEVLAPQLEQFRDKSSGKTDDMEAIKFLQSGTLVGLLPVPHPILIRKYRTNSKTTLWFRACTWGAIYVNSNIWRDTYIRLVRVV